VEKLSGYGVCADIVRSESDAADILSQFRCHNDRSMELPGHQNPPNTFVVVILPQKTGCYNYWLLNLTKL
jgi:hypothetical protein